MQKIDLREAINAKSENFMSRYPGFMRSLVYHFLERVVHAREVNEFVDLHHDKRGIRFIETMFEYLNFSYLISNSDREKIPSEGKLVIVANHPLGAMDGVALIKMIYEIRKDVRIVLNDLLMMFEPLQEFAIPFDVFSTKNQKESVNRIRNALLNEEAVIFFPAAEVSRFGVKGIRDGYWKKGAVQFAQKFDAPILPVFVKGFNSPGFYCFSLLHRNFSTFLLADEIFRKRNHNITFKIGDPIPPSVLKASGMNLNDVTKLLKKHVYRLGQGRKGVFKTVKTIIHPVPKHHLREELADAEFLVKPQEKKHVYLVHGDKAPHIIREISRLREQTFRKVGEGTGGKLDTDEYDAYYKHIVVWDDENLEIMGSYRIGDGREIMQKFGPDAFYSASLFDFSEDFHPILANCVELGRSFVQYKYWKSHALEYLWKGIGAFLTRNPEIRWMFGCISISDSYNELAKSMMVYYYKKWYGNDQNLAVAKKQFVLSKKAEEEAEATLNGENYTEEFTNMKIALKGMGFTIPVLYKEYTRLCDYGGLTFIDFGVDESFSNTVDGLGLFDLQKLSAKSYRRYFPDKE